MCISDLEETKEEEKKENPDQLSAKIKFLYEQTKAKAQKGKKDK